MKTKGYTVHMADCQGKPLCGVRLNLHGFLGRPNVHENPRYVTCPDCERKVRAVIEWHAQFMHADETEARQPYPDQAQIGVFTWQTAHED